MSEKNSGIIKIEKNDSMEKFREIGNRVQKGEVKWMAYAIEGDKAYHYYIVLK